MYMSTGAVVTSRMRNRLHRNVLFMRDVYTFINFEVFDLQIDIWSASTLMSKVELVDVTRLNDGNGPPECLEVPPTNGDLPTDNDHEATTKLVYLDIKEGPGAPEISARYSKAAHSPEHDEECDGEEDSLLHKVPTMEIICVSL